MCDQPDTLDDLIANCATYPADMAAKIVRLRAQRDQLVAALTPFADLARQIERDHRGWYHEHFQFVDPPIEMRWLIMASAVIAAVEEKP